MGDPSETLPTLLRALMAMRSRFAEIVWSGAAARGVGQYVIIGAGLDTFPWRQPSFAAVLRIFAVDHPASLSWVQQRLRDRRLGRPGNLVHVPADLEQQMLSEQLEACGFDPKVPTSAQCSASSITSSQARSMLSALYGRSRCGK